MGVGKHGKVYTHGECETWRADLTVDAAEKDLRPDLTPEDVIAAVRAFYMGAVYTPNFPTYVWTRGTHCGSVMAMTVVRVTVENDPYCFPLATEDQMTNYAVALADWLKRFLDNRAVFVTVYPVYTIAV